LIADSIAPAAQPVASQATKRRECFKMLFAPDAKSRAFSSLFFCDTKTSVNSMSALYRNYKILNGILDDTSVRIFVLNF
jgi:hypothetical protein